MPAFAIYPGVIWTVLPPARAGLQRTNPGDDRLPDLNDRYRFRVHTFPHLAGGEGALQQLPGWAAIDVLFRQIDQIVYAVDRDLHIVANAARHHATRCARRLSRSVHRRFGATVSPSGSSNTVNVNCFPSGQSIFGNHMPAFSA